MPLAAAVKLWPTPCATDHKRANPLDRRPQSDDDLPTRVLRMWPTPTVHGNTNKPVPGTKAGLGLGTAVKLWPTPAHRDYRYPNATPYSERGGGSKGEQLPNADGGALNPTWVEWLMGFPLGWTDLGASETRSSRKSSK
jgi:hypothetical protein